MIAGDKVDDICCPWRVTELVLRISQCIVQCAWVLEFWLDGNQIVAEAVEYDVRKLDEVVGNN